MITALYMVFNIITIFPKIFESYFSESIISRARKNKIIDIAVYDLRDFAKDKRRTTDDTPYGGGAGMIMKIEPIYECVKHIKLKAVNFKSVTNQKHKTQDSKSRVIVFSAKGKRYTQKDAERLADYDNLIFICGRYEGVDERVIEYIADEEISVGDYVLTGGEIPAMVLVDSISRLLPGVLGNSESLREESFSNIKKSFLEYPQYTKPEVFNGWKVPSVLLSGDHKKINEWRKSKSKLKVIDQNIVANTKQASEKELLFKDTKK